MSESTNKLSVLQSIPSNNFFLNLHWQTFLAEC